MTKHAHAQEFEYARAAPQLLALLLLAAAPAQSLEFLDDIQKANEQLGCEYPVAVLPVFKEPLYGLDQAAPNRLASHDPQVRLPVFAETYTQRKTFQLPDHPECVFAVPDAVEVFQKLESSSSVSTTLAKSYHYSLTEHFSSFSFTAGLSAGAFSLDFKYSKTSADIEEHVGRHKELAGFARFEVTYLSIALYPPFMLTLAPQFRTALSRLPDSADTPAHRNLYQQFLQTFGTDYCFALNGGASMRRVLFVTSAFEREYSESKTVEQFGVEFSIEGKKLNLSGFFNDTSSSIDEYFANNTVTSTDFVGGDPSLVGTAEWQPSTVYAPALIGGRFAPLYSIANCDENPTKCDSLRNVTLEYLAAPAESLERAARVRGALPSADSKSLDMGCNPSTSTSSGDENKNTAHSPICKASTGRDGKRVSPNMMAPLCNWRFLFSAVDGWCDCHGPYPGTWSIMNCRPMQGQLYDGGRIIPFSSTNANLHAPGVGIAYFYADNACQHEVWSIQIGDNAGTPVDITTQDAHYKYSCYCCGDGGPCKC